MSLRPYREEPLMVAFPGEDWWSIAGEKTVWACKKRYRIAYLGFMSDRSPDDFDLEMKVLLIESEERPPFTDVLIRRAFYRWKIKNGSLKKAEKWRHDNCVVVRLNPTRIFGALGRIYFDINCRLLIITYDLYLNPMLGEFEPVEKIDDLDKI